MANENVKIKINEVDLTKPGGSGIAPSDIAFVPGFSINPNAPKNIPTLCNDYLEFETIFGKVPKVLSTLDVKDYTKYGFIAGSFDASYIYAKELLLQGMPVIYSNIVNTSSNVPMNLTSLEEDDVSIQKLDDKSDTLTEYSYTDTDEEGNPVFDKNSDRTNGIYRFTYEIPDQGKPRQFKAENRLTYYIPFTIPAGISGVAEGETYTSDITPSITTIALNVDLYDNELGKYHNAVSIIGADVKCSISNEDITVTKLSDNGLELEFKNETTSEYDTTIELTVDISVLLKPYHEDKLKTIDLQISRIYASCLDVFYNIPENVKDNASIKEQLNLVSDKSIYSVKYITSGGYPSIVYEETSQEAVSKFSTEMLKTASSRGDAVALIDYQRNEYDVPFSLSDPDSFYNKIHEAMNGVSDAEYGALFYPWGEYSCGSSLSNVNGLETDDVYMPASFGYMLCLARAIKTSPNWLAMAGVSRGIVPKLNRICTPNNVLSNNIAEEMQPKFGVEGHKISVNCITNIRPYGLTLWGNRTLKEMNREGAVALNFLNTRNMLSDIKKVLYTTAKSLMFEQNSDNLWLRFKAGITPLLNQLKTGQGISDYKIVKSPTLYNGNPIQKGELAAIIKIYPLYAVEYFELTVEINDEDVVIS